MPNKKGGKKFKKGKKQNNYQEKILLYRDPKEDQEYAKILKVNGSGRYNLFCFDGKDRLGICAGNIRRKVRISVNDIVLISKWDFQDTKCSIIHKYADDETHKLKAEGQFPANIKLDNEYSFISTDDDPIFNYGDPSDSDSDDIAPQPKMNMNPSSSESDQDINLDDI